MAIKCGIVGLPNVGKSTLFNALTRAQIPAENYPFCTIDPNVGVVPVPDARLDALAVRNQDLRSQVAADLALARAAVVTTNEGGALAFSSLTQFTAAGSVLARDHAEASMGALEQMAGEGVHGPGDAFVVTATDQRDTSEGGTHAGSAFSTRRAMPASRATGPRHGAARP